MQLPTLPSVSASLLAQGEFDPITELLRPALLAISFTALGIFLFIFCIWIIVKLSPFSVVKEIEEDQNTSLGIIIGSMIIGVAIILAAALVG